MSQATITETFEHAIEYPNAKIRPIELYDNGPRRSARVPDVGPAIEVNRIGALDLESIERIHEATRSSHIRLLAQAGAPHEGAPMPKVVTRRILTITDPWAAPANS
jgi:hypothetical protein